MGLMWSVPLVTKMTASDGTTVDINAAFTESVGTPYPLAISKIGDVILVDNSAARGRFAQPGYIIQEGYSLSTRQTAVGPPKPNANTMVQAVDKLYGERSLHYFHI